jgi:hypothetical protein
MPIEALIVEKKSADAFERIVPATFRLGDDGELSLAAPTVVSRTETGVRLTCVAAVRWPVLGLTSTVTIDRVTLALRKEIISTDEGPRAAFEVRIEELARPGAASHGHGDLASLLNDELSRQRVALRGDLGTSPHHEVVVAVGRTPAQELPGRPTDVCRAA